MSLALVLYGALLLAVIVGLWAAYRLLGTPSRLAAGDYRLVLDDAARSVGRSAERLREAIANAESGRVLEGAAHDARKIFQTAYYQTLRLRPAAGPDTAAAGRATLARACEAYDWASQMIGSESIANPAVRESALRLLEAGDEELRRAVRELSELPPTARTGSMPPSPPGPP